LTLSALAYIYLFFNTLESLTYANLAKASSVCEKFLVPGY
jgi:hypothetical protein